jgi:hypothetical protein
MRYPPKWQLFSGRSGDDPMDGKLVPLNGDLAPALTVGG